MPPHNPVCPVCHSGDLEGFLQRDHVPVHQNLICHDSASARSVRKGAIRMCVCLNCGFAHNQGFEDKLLEYGSGYDNTQIKSSAFSTHINERVSSLIEDGVRNKVIVEVGCGKGEFLRKLVEPHQLNNRGHGFDPAYQGPMVDCHRRLEFHQRFYDEACSNIAADIVICRHVIEHVEDPVRLLKTIRKALTDSPNARVFFETPCLDWILRNQVVWDFFYEHCSLFTAHSLKTAFEQAGFEIESVTHVFGGQYLWLQASPGFASPVTQTKHNAVEQTISGARIFREIEQQHISDWGRRLLDLRAVGRVALWGAGAKGATFANLIDSKCDLIRYVVDINPKKQGKFLAGSGHPIISPMNIQEAGIDYAIVLNPEYYAEIKKLTRDLKQDIMVVDFMDEKFRAA